MKSEIGKLIKGRFAGATVELDDGTIVMLNGQIIGPRGEKWWKEKMEKHKKWRRSNKNKARTRLILRS